MSKQETLAETKTNIVIIFAVMPINSLNNTSFLYSVFPCKSKYISVLKYQNGFY